MTQKKLLELVKKHKEVVVYVKHKAIPDAFIKKRLLMAATLIQHRSDVFGLWGGYRSCFEMNKQGAWAKPNIKNSISRMFAFDKLHEYTIGRIEARKNGKVLWETK